MDTREKEPGNNQSQSLEASQQSTNPSHTVNTQSQSIAVDSQSQSIAVDSQSQSIAVDQCQEEVPQIVRGVTGDGSDFEDDDSEVNRFSEDTPNKVNTHGVRELQSEGPFEIREATFGDTQQSEDNLIQNIPADQRQSLDLDQLFQMPNKEMQQLLNKYQDDDDEQVRETVNQLQDIQIHKSIPKSFKKPPQTAQTHDILNDLKTNKRLFDEFIHRKSFQFR